MSNKTIPPRCTCVRVPTNAYALHVTLFLNVACATLEGAPFCRLARIVFSAELSWQPLPKTTGEHLPVTSVAVPCVPQPRRTGAGRRSGDRRPYRAFITSRAMAMVRSTSASVWASDVKPASNCVGAKYTPRSRIIRCHFANFAVSAFVPSS